MRDPTRQDTILVARERLERTKAWLLLAGCGAVVTGVLGAAAPETGAAVFAGVVGVGAVIGGLLQTLRGALFHRWRPRSIAFRLVSGLTALAIGIALLWKPADAVAALGLAVSVLLIGHGTARALVMARDGDDRWWMWAVIALALTAIAAVVLAAGWPGSAVWAFGTVGGLLLFALGWWLIMLATAADSRSDRNLAGRWPPR